MAADLKTLEKYKIAILKSGKKKKDVAEAIGISTCYLVNMLNGKDHLSEVKKKSLNKILNTNY